MWVVTGDTEAGSGSSGTAGAALKSPISGGVGRRESVGVLVVSELSKSGGEVGSRSPINGGVCLRSLGDAGDCLRSSGDEVVGSRLSGGGVDPRSLVGVDGSG